MFKRHWLLIIMFMLLAGCGSWGPSDEPANDEGPVPLPSEQEQEQPLGQDEEQGDEAEDSAPSQDEQIGEEVEEAEEDEDVAIAYFLNSIWDIKPIDPNDEDKVVLITIDDGPKGEDGVISMLDTLDKHEAKAIFFVNGWPTRNNPDLLVEIYERGHAIGNHSWEHINLSKESNEVIDENIEKMQQLVEELTGERPRFFRAPHGATNSYLREKVAAEGMLYMNWSAAAEDWKPEYRSAETIIPHVLSQLRPGSNLLLHEVPGTVAAFDALLTAIREEGYTFVNPHAIHLEPGNPTAED